MRKNLKEVCDIAKTTNIHIKMFKFLIITKHIVKKNANIVVFKQLLKNYILKDQKVIKVVNNFNNAASLKYSSTIRKYLDSDSKPNTSSNSNSNTNINNESKKTRRSKIEYSNNWWEETNINEKDYIHEESHEDKNKLFLLQYIKNFIPAEIPKQQETNIIKVEQRLEINHTNFELLATTENLFSAIFNDPISPKSDEEFDNKLHFNKSPRNFDRRTSKTTKYLLSQNDDEEDDEGKLKLKFTVLASTNNKINEVDDLQKIFKRKYHHDYSYHDFTKKEKIEINVKQKEEEEKKDEEKEEIEIKPVKSNKIYKIEINETDPVINTNSNKNLNLKKPKIHSRDASSSKRITHVNKHSGVSKNIQLRDLNTVNDFKNISHDHNMFNNSRDL